MDKSERLTHKNSQDTTTLMGGEGGGGCIRRRFSGTKMKRKKLMMNATLGSTKCRVGSKVNGISVSNFLFK